MTINLEKSLEIDAPVADIFATWLDLPSASQLLPGGPDGHVELTEQIEHQRLSWKITGPEVVGTATVQLAPTGEHQSHTQVTLTAHYPNGLGPSTNLAQVTSDMENGLANVARVLRGEALEHKDHATTDQPRATTYPDVTESAATLYRSMSAATEAWATTVNKTFEVLSTLAWFPLHTAFVPTVDKGQAAKPM